MRAERAGIDGKPPFRVRVWHGTFVLLCAAWLAAHSAARADPQGDFQAGSAAYDRGDVIMAMEKLGAAADAGHVPAMLKLAYVLNKSGDNEAAFRTYMRAAEAGNVEAVLAVGVLYANGDGVDRDTQQALIWIRRAADAGHAPAIMTLAHIHQDGALGLAPDRDEAMRLFKAAADAGYEPAKQHLEQMHAQRPREPHDD